MQLEARAPEAGRIEIVETERPEPGSGELRVAVERCGICGSDLHFFTGHQPVPPHCPGHEISGTVDAVGTGVRSVKEGDRVAIEPLVRCGACRYCRAGDYHLCPSLQIHGLMIPGGMATSLVVPDYAAHLLPGQVPSEVGALIEPLAVTVHALRLAGVGSDTPVLVLGAGSVGLLAVTAARHLEAPFVAVTGRHPHQRELAAALGADQVLEPDDVFSVAEPPRAVIETVGGKAQTVSDAVNVIDRGGTVAVVGVFDTTPEFSPLFMLVKEVRLVGSMIYNAPGGRSDFEIALDIARERSTDLRSLITHTLPLEQAQHAFETAADKSTGAVKVLIDPTG